MKKALIILVAITLGLTTTSMATTPPPVAAKLPTDFKQEIAKHIDYPSFARDNAIEGVVTMRLTLDDSLMVKIVALDSSSPELGRYVKQELTNLTIKNTSFVPGNIYYMKVRFNLVSGF